MLKNQILENQNAYCRNILISFINHSHLIAEKILQKKNHDFEKYTIKRVFRRSTIKSEL